MNKTRVLFLFVSLAALLFACRKDPLSTDPADKLEFSSDTVIFDTVFTTIGSTTKRLLIYNPSDKRVVISSIQLAGGSASKFRLNVDGIPGISHQDIELQGKDSMFLFVEVTLDPAGQNLPLLVTDSILFMTNGNLQDVDLVAYGQDAHFYYPTNYSEAIGAYSIVDCDDVWTDDKPYVIYGMLVIDTDCSLDIMEGVDVYLHKNSTLMAYEGGTLRVNGQQGNPVTFQGDRLEPFYDNVPGQWERIWFYDGSINNKIDYAIIKNGNNGIVAAPNESTSPNVTITNTQVYQMAGVCIVGQNAIIKAENSVFANGGQFCGAFIIGGDYDFRHCTFGNYYQYGNRQTPSILLNNYYEDENGNIQLFDLTNAYFGNCIITGNLENEIGFDSNTGALFNYRFHHTLLRIDPEVNTSDITFFDNIIKTQSDTFFVDQVNNDFHLDASSPAIDAGSFSIMLSSPSLITDLDGVGRKLAPDMGAYESRE
ncbi:MAG: choice-of-anchor Q domain-containing protein [Bacteroidia bacterium]